MKITILLALIFLVAGCGGGFSIYSTPTGLINITSVPDQADVYLNGVYNGSKTNCEFQLGAQTKHTIAIKKEGYRDFQATFSLEANEEKKIEVVLESL